MVTEEKKAELLEKLKSAVIAYDEDTAQEASQEVLAVGMNANDAIFNGLVAGMVEVGKMFEAQEYFVPELLMCADALYAGLDILKPHVQQMDLGVRGSVVIGTVEGDVHDIGKNIVKMMFDVAETRAKLGPKALIFGNYDPYNVLVAGTPELVRTTVRKCLEDGVSAVWPGCDIWPTVPPENVKAMLDEVANYRRA